MDTMLFQKQREAVAAFMRRLYDRGLTTCSGGNISLRLNDNLYCITPSKLDKGMLSSEQICIVDFDGTNHTPGLELSIETEMHRRVLLARPDIKAVVHAHPSFASAFTAMGPQIDTGLLAESFYLIEKPVWATYARMGTTELAAEVESAVGCGNVVLMENHGVLTVGKSLLGAFDLIEVLENSAKMTCITRLMGQASGLTETAKKELLNMKYGSRKG